jgi:hypothetical protein
MMNRRNTMILALSAALALALPVVASAQTSRVEGMALQGDYIKDYSSIFTYTSSVANVGNLVYGELGNTDITLATSDRGVGAVLGNLWDGRLGVWSIHVREQTPALGQGDASSSGATGSHASDPNTNSMQSFDLMWAKKFGTTSFGLRLNRSFAKAEGGLGYFNGALFGPLTNLSFDVLQGPGADPNVSRNIWGFGGGLGFEVNPSTNAEVSLLWQTRTFELKDSLANKTANDGSSAYQIAGRAMWQWQPNVMVIPVVKFYNYDLSTKSTGAVSATSDNTLKGWQAGASGNWTLGTNDLFILGVTFAQNRVEQEAGVVSLPAGLLSNFDVTNGKITETMAPQVFAALETHVNNWLTLRFGANKPAYEQIKAEDKTNGKTAKIQFSPFQMNLGAGVKLGTLQLDAVLNDSFPQTLGGFFSNTADYVSFAKVTATYAF